ncbi:MAG: DUF2344 domain-containing protein [Phycisphaerae bacterium]|nr:DUF2344 domain-containing protein [Phycisphaerae bacterium]
MPATGGTAAISAVVEQRIRWVIFHAVNGDLRFISHHDTLRLFRRACARAALPIRYSQGFNPHPKIMIPLPRPVGIASDVEAVVFELMENSDDVPARLGQQLPREMPVHQGRRLQEGERLQPRSAAYRLSLDGAAPEAFASRVTEIMASPTLPVTRQTPGEPSARTVDIRPYLQSVELESDAVRFELLIEGGRTAKPAEIAGLLGFDATTINHRIRRLHVTWAS